MPKETTIHKPPLLRKRTTESCSISLIHEISLISHKMIERECPEMQRSCRMIMKELSFGDNLTQLDLVRATHLKPPTVSVSLQKMEKDGIVVRRQDENDLRVTRVFLTEQGRQMHQNIISKIREKEKYAESCLSEDERKELCSLLHKIRNHLIGGLDSLEKED